MRTTLSKIFLLLFLPFFSIAQKNDFQTWTSVSASKKLIKKTDLIVKQAARFRENSSIKSKLFTNIQIKRKYNKHFSFAVGYRFSNDWNKRLILEQKNRFYTDIYYKDKFKKRFLLDLRARWQTQGNFEGYSSLLRQKSVIAYNIRKTKLEPLFAIEYFLNIESIFVDKLRYTFSISHPITKDLDAEITYRIQQEYYVDNPETLYIFEGKLSYDF